MSFSKHWSQQDVQLDWAHLKMLTASQTTEQVCAVLQKVRFNKKRDWQDFLTLVSHTAAPYLEQMAQYSQQLTRQRFGHNIQLYVPLYLSNLCANECTYCGFSMSNKLKRKTLSLEEIDAEIAAIQHMGFDSVLLVTGEHQNKVGMDYFAEVIPHIRKQVSYLAIEVQPLTQSEYTQMVSWGIDAVMVYQETYHRQRYAECHLHGNKQDFDFRLDTADRAINAGMDKIGLGTLLGLSEDWRVDSVMVAAHLDYLQKKYWQSRYSLSFPRLRPCTGGLNPLSNLRDRDLVQLICAYRLCFPEVELSLSTRESAQFRNHVFGLGITHASAASQTQPGGYAEQDQTKALEQFEVDDQRSANEVAASIISAGLDPVWTERQCNPW